MSYRETGSAQTDSRQILQSDYQTAWYQELIMILQIRSDVLQLFSKLYIRSGLSFLFKSTYPSTAMATSFFTPECSNTSFCDASGSNNTLKVNGLTDPLLSTYNRSPKELVVCSHTPMDEKMQCCSARSTQQNLQFCCISIVSQTLEFEISSYILIQILENLSVAMPCWTVSRKHFTLV